MFNIFLTKAAHLLAQMCFSTFPLFLFHLWKKIEKEIDQKNYYDHYLMFLAINQINADLWVTYYEEEN